MGHSRTERAEAAITAAPTTRSCRPLRVVCVCAYRDVYVVIARGTCGDAFCSAHLVCGISVRPSSSSHLV